MNIFILDKDSSISAKMHFDTHVVKMILESAQILSTICRREGEDIGYKKTHLYHPCTIWAGESLSNWIWLKNFALELNKEYKYRFDHNKNHKSAELILKLPNPNIKDKGLTPFAQAMPDKYKDKEVVKAYRRYYICEKMHLLKYTKRRRPKWIEKYKIYIKKNNK